MKKYTYKDVYNFRVNVFKEWEYELEYWKSFDYSSLSWIMYRKRSGQGGNDSFNDVIIMADTETSKSKIMGVSDNHVCAWTISIRAFNTNICTLYGTLPQHFCDCVNKILNEFEGKETFMYFHNLSYDWQFLRKFMFRAWGLPVKQLNVKPHVPISIKFENGLTIKDSLILAQRSLDKWAKDMQVEHQKACGKWDYEKKRDQAFMCFSKDELEYIEHDTLAGVECIQKYIDVLNKNIATLPLTATGIPREMIRKIGKDNRAKDRFMRMVLTYEQQKRMEDIFHGGYTHANRDYINWLIDEVVKCYDFASSYPYVLLAYKYPMEKFTFYKKTCSMKEILDNSEKYAFTFKLVLVDVQLKKDVPMPSLQLSKAEKTINAIVDNGRILSADYVEINLNEVDLCVISEQYQVSKHACIDVEFAEKGYLPRWLTDYIFSLFKDKTLLKGGDPVAYALAKAKLNSCYGMMVQKPIKQVIDEHYVSDDEHKSGEYTIRKDNEEELYEKYVKNHNSILNYQWGVWCTSYAFRNLFELGKCVDYKNGGIWLYSDTDSCYATKWDEKKIKKYNQGCKNRLQQNGYDCVIFNNRESWLGVAELDGVYSQFKTMGAKRYCVRDKEKNKLKITVAGVPKIGAECLNDDINNFHPNFVFNGDVTGKLTHEYIERDEIYRDVYGNWIGDSINLYPADYCLSMTHIYKWSDIETEDIEVICYEE